MPQGVVAKLMINMGNLMRGYGWINASVANRNWRPGARLAQRPDLMVLPAIWVCCTMQLGTMQYSTS